MGFVLVVVLISAVGALAFACRPGYGVASRIFFSLATAFALSGLTLPGGAAVGVAAILLLVLGGITTIVDAKRIRIGL